jgi:ABC-type tungstate transport system permease subunit
MVKQTNLLIIAAIAIVVIACGAYYYYTLSVPSPGSFVSRTDGSGTHALEQRLWVKAGITGYVNQSWYWSANSGMAATIRVANEKSAYTITDRGTYLKLKSEMNDTLSLVILCENDSALLNPYGIILLNSTKYPNIQSDLAQKFLLFMISPEGQALIANYTVNGKQLFFPCYGNPESIGLPSENSTVMYLNSLLQSNWTQPRPTELTRFILSTTTSTVDTGLLSYLKPYYDAIFNANLTWLSLGTGAAITTAARGDADGLLVHDRVREDAFVASGNGTLRVTVMYNDFVIIGPASDPAHVAGQNATLAMLNIASYNEK